MYRYIKKIELLFENCEQVTLPVSALGCVVIRSINMEIFRGAINAIYEGFYADEVALEILPNANEVGSNDTFDDGAKTILERIMAWNDVTLINVIYDTGEELCLSVDYDDGGDDRLGAPNVNQKTYLSKNGALYLVIGKGKAIEDYFQLDEIDGEGYAGLIEYTIDMNAEKAVDDGKGNH